MNYGVDRYKRPQKSRCKKRKPGRKVAKSICKVRSIYAWRTLPKREEEKTVAEARRYPSEPQENLLYFMEKNAPLLESWQREILRIVRKVSQYFYPQNRLR